LFVLLIFVELLTITVYSDFSPYVEHLLLQLIILFSQRYSKPWYDK